MLGGVFYNKLMKAFETKAAPVTEDAEAEEWAATAQEIIEQGPTWIAICIDSACRLLYVCRTACGRAFIWTLLAAWLPWRCALRTGMALCYVGCFDVVLS